MCKKRRSAKREKVRPRFSTPLHQTPPISLPESVFNPPETLIDKIIRSTHSSPAPQVPLIPQTQRFEDEEEEEEEDEEDEEDEEEMSPSPAYSSATRVNPSKDDVDEDIV
jgi:hypothetical protein